jgi:hypothetical protein
MLTIFLDRILVMKKEGNDVDQVRAVQPTRDYHPRWGASTGFWTTRMLDEASY